MCEGEGALRCACVWGVLRVPQLRWAAAGPPHCRHLPPSPPSAHPTASSHLGLPPQYLWNPLSWAMEAAAIIAIALLDYADFALIVALLIVNATISFVEEANADRAIKALTSGACWCAGWWWWWWGVWAGSGGSGGWARKLQCSAVRTEGLLHPSTPHPISHTPSPTPHFPHPPAPTHPLPSPAAALAPKAKAIRDGVATTIEAKFLVPGDIIIVSLGDIVPADIKILAEEGSSGHPDDETPLQVDQAALTGESLPVKKYAGNTAFSGACVSVLGWCGGWCV